MRTPVSIKHKETFPGPNPGASWLLIIRNENAPEKDGPDLFQISIYLYALLIRKYVLYFINRRECSGEFLHKAQYEKRPQCTIL